MNEALLQMLVKALGLKPEAVQALIGSVEKISGHFEDIKALLQDNLYINKQILEALKKGKK